MLALISSFLFTACAPVALGLTATQICTNIAKTVAQVKHNRQVAIEAERAARTMYPDDFVDVGDPLAKAIKRMGPPYAKEQGSELTFYFFKGQRLVAAQGQIFAKDLRVGVDKEEKIAKIEILESEEVGGSVAGSGQRAEGS
jgi:hypothetical protein